MQAYPEAVEAHLGEDQRAVDACSATVNAHPGALEAHLGNC